MCDKLVYDLAQEVEGSPSVFIRKDWINILDNQNQSYVANQSVLDTSQLSNSNKWMSYREAYFSVPLVVSIASANGRQSNASAIGGGLWTPVSTTDSADQAVGLKNWYGNIIHSFTLDYNGTTIIQQTPFVNMWNTFKLMTSLSYQDILTQGPTIGFYPDDCESWEYYSPTTSRVLTPVAYDATKVVVSGNGVCNNTNQIYVASEPSLRYQNFRSGLGNQGFAERCKWLTFDLAGIPTANYTGIIIGAPSLTDVNNGAAASVSTPYSSLITEQYMKAMYKGYIFNKINQAGTQTLQTTAGVLQYAIVATIYLKHIHSFFNMIPLLKGAFMKMTMNLNNVSCSVLSGGNFLPAAGDTASHPISTKFTICDSVQTALGGSNMLMCASINGFNGGFTLSNTTSITPTAGGVGAYAMNRYLMNLSVGSVCLDNTISNIGGVIGAPLSKSIYLYIPAYTFNPTFEQAYLSSPVKQIKYTDIYQYQVLSVGAGDQINNLLTNGIANVKSVLVLPFYSSRSGSGVDSSTPSNATGVQVNSNTGFTQGYPVWQSPFDTAGCGTTSPLSHITNFNIQVSGQNAIYNLQKYTFEQFNNQLYGQNAVNGGLTDGITSSMVSRQAFDLAYCYYYVNVERMLPVEQSVPKSIQLIGTNASAKAMDYLCFIEYGTEVSIDALTGSRV